jgi:hypothetical protein
VECRWVPGRCGTPRAGQPPARRPGLRAGTRGAPGGGGWGVPDRLLVDLNDDGQAAVSSWPDGELPQEVSRAPLAWPLAAGALEDLRWYLEDDEAAAREARLLYVAITRAD